jgi:hypothetical protein
MANITIIQRVTHLLTLAADAGASENEARNAALTAAKLIAQHGLHVVDARPSSTTTTTQWSRTTTATWESRVTAWEAAWKSREAKWDEWERAARERERAEPPKHPWVAQEPSKCGSCWADIPTGSDCFYGPYPKHEWRCVPCAQRDAPWRRKPKSKKTKASKK